MKVRSLQFSISLLAAMSFCYAVSGQSVFPTAADQMRWEYATWNFWGGYCTVSYVQTGEEVDICGMTYTEVYDCYGGLGNCQLVGYYREEGERVLIRRKDIYWNGTEWLDTVDCSVPEGLMFDFSMEDGDTVDCQINYPNSETKFWKTGETMEVSEGISRRVLNMNFLPYPNYSEIFYSMKWIEGIGSDIFPFYSFACIGDHCEQEQQLTSVWQNGILVYRDTVLTFSFPCTDWIDETIDEVPRENTFVLYPNPATDKVQVACDNPNLDFKIEKIYNVLGRVLPYNYVDNENRVITLNELPAGIYYVTISLNGQIFIKKVIRE